MKAVLNVLKLVKSKITVRLLKLTGTYENVKN